MGYQRLPPGPAIPKRATQTLCLVPTLGRLVAMDVGAAHHLQYQLFLSASNPE